MTVMFSIIKSDHKMKKPQAPHCDIATAFDYQKWKKQFPFSILIGLEEYSILDILNIETHSVQRVCYSKGDILFFRGDMPHAGTGNLCSRDHYRIHAYVDPS